MINRVVIEGYIRETPKRLTTKSGKIFYTGTLACYRENGTKEYDITPVLFSRQQYDMYRKLFGNNAVRVCIVGHIRSFKGANQTIQCDFFGIYPLVQVFKGGAKEIKDDDESNEVLDEEDTTAKPVDDEVMPF